MFEKRDALGQLKQYILPFSGLSLGVHQFHFDLDEKFFAEFDFNEFETARIGVDIELEKQERMMIFNFAIKGIVNVMCDRCLDNFDFSVDGRERLIVKLGEEREEDDDEIVIIPENEHQLDLSTYLFEYVVLLLPMKKTHPDDENGNTTCNPEIIKRINQLSAPEPDPRWDSLKDLINEN